MNVSVDLYNPVRHQPLPKTTEKSDLTGWGTTKNRIKHKGIPDPSPVRNSKIWFVRMESQYAGGAEILVDKYLVVNFS